MASKKPSPLGAQWMSLHGHALPRDAQALAPDALQEMSAYHPANWTDRPNVFEAAVLGAADSHRLTLWEPFVNVLPMHALGNGDVLFVHVPSPAQAGARAAIVVWNHETDALEAPRPDDLEGRPGGDPSVALRLAARGDFLVELLARGRFDLDRFLSTEHGPLALDNPAWAENVRVFAPTGLYAMWRLFFAGDDAALAKVLALSERSAARYVRDAAAVVRELLAGRNELGALGDVRAVRAETTRLMNDPALRERALATQRRAAVDRRLAGQPGPARLRRVEGATGEAIAGARQAALGALALEVVETPPGRARLVLRRQGRSLSALPLCGHGDPFEVTPAFHVVRQGPAPVFALWRKCDPASRRYPNDGALVLYAVANDRLVQVAAFELDLAGLEQDDGDTLVRTEDGARYRLEGVDDLPAPAAVEEASPIPGTPAEPPAASTEPRIGDDRIELGPRSLRVWRGETLLLEEPLTEAYRMAVVPERRMVAIHGASFELRPTVDVLWVRPLDGPVEPGQGACSWICWPVDGRTIDLRATADRLFVFDGSTWIEVDARCLTEVPSWIQARGWR